VAAPFRFRSDKQFDVVGFGYNSIDHVCVIPHPLRFDSKQRFDTYLRQPGGQIPTALVALQRWGLRTAYVGPLSDDEGGRLQRDSLVSEGVNIEGALHRGGVGSQTAIILVDRVTGERSIAWRRPDGLRLAVEELDRRMLTAGRVLLMDADDMDTSLQAARWAKQEDIVVILDIDAPAPGVENLLAVTDVVVASLQFAQALTGKVDVSGALRRMHSMGPRFCAVTLGASGAQAVVDGRAHYIPAPKIAAVDTTSAGDVFHAGCIFGLLQAWAPERALRFAVAAASLECSGLGGRAAIPSLQCVLALAGFSSELPKES
jgi:sugar/nucleoside kinase (ribokinase family)